MSTEPGELQTSLPALYHVATAAVKGGGLVLCGDPNQLPVVVRSRASLAQLYAADPFRIVRHNPAPGGIRIARLRTQYRMDHAIANLVNCLVYGGSLITHESVRARPPLGRNLTGAHLVLVDSSGAMPGGRRVRRYGNRVHAQLIAKILERLGATGPSAGTVAVLSRFRDQVATIRAVVPDRPGLLVDTVHALQGGEADTIILDFSAAPEHDHLGDYLVDSSPDAVGTRLLNVALTRARRRVILVANVRFLSTHPHVPESAMSRQILSHVAGHGVVLRAEDL